jgi:ABC-2 type transport system permease protein
MKRLIALIKKEMFHMLRDKRSMLILIGMPIVQVTLFGFALTNEIQQAKIAIFDQAKDEITQEVKRHLLASGYFKLTDQLSSHEEIEQTFQRKDIKLAIVFEPNFGKDLHNGENADMQVLVDASNPNTATTLINYVKAIVNDYSASLTTASASRIQTEIEMAYNPRQKGVYLFVPGVITVILMLISAMMTSITIAREKEMGNMEILMVSPLRPLTIIVGKTIPYIFLSFLIGIVLLLMGRFVFGLPIHGSLLLLLCESILFILTTLTLGIFISTQANSQQKALMMSLFGLMMPTILLSGFIFPIDSMPAVLQWLSHLIPARWFNQIIKDILLKGNGFVALIKETSILMGMMTLFVVLSILNFKTRMT